MKGTELEIFRNHISKSWLQKYHHYLNDFFIIYNIMCSKHNFWTLESYILKQALTVESFSALCDRKLHMGN